MKFVLALCLLLVGATFVSFAGTAIGAVSVGLMLARR